jgi:hypothetical protein
VSKQEKLLNHLIRVKNRSGTLKPAPHNLKKLKEALNGVPFQLDVKSMSGVVTSQNMLQGIQKLAKQLGGLGEVGQFKNVMAKARESGVNGSSLATANVAAIADHVPVEDLEEAVGGALALGISLMAYMPQDDQKEIDREARDDG